MKVDEQAKSGRRCVSKICFSLIACLAVLAISQELYALGLYGDPTAISKKRQLQVEVGGGKTIDGQQLKFTETRASVQASTFSSSDTIADSADKFKSEHIFLGIVYGMSDTAQAFARVGGVRSNEPEISSDFAASYALGLRLSPKQQGAIRVGLIGQVTQTEHHFESGPGSFFSPDITPNGPNVTIFSGLGQLSEDLKLTRFDVLLGAGVPTSVVSPYAGLLLTFIIGSDSATITGNQSDVCTYPRGGPGCTSTPSGPFTVELDSDVESESLIGGVVGVALNATEAVGLTLEAQFGLETAFLAAARMAF
jgi:hypothetical protein